MIKKFALEIWEIRRDINAGVGLISQSIIVGCREHGMVH